MTPDKLEALRRLAADERTPIEEARNAALAYVRGGGERPSIDWCVPREELTRASEEIAALRNRLTSLEVVARRKQEERDRAVSEHDKLHKILTKLLDTRKAEELAASVRATAEQEAREAVGYGEKKPPAVEPAGKVEIPLWNPPRRSHWGPSDPFNF